MASRRQRQFDRKYSSYKKYTATEDVSYAAHTSRSSYRSEAITHRTSDRGRSSSSEIITGAETRSLPVYIAIQDYTPEPGDTESVTLEQGQIVEVLDKKNAASWLIRTKARPPRSGWVPGSYFETPTEYYKQRRRTREIAAADLNLTEEQEAIMKRDQVYHDLLRSEEEYVNELRHLVEDYIKAIENESVPKEVENVREQLIMNLKELCNFHANVMLKGLQYYSDDPGKVGQTFIRLERDFDHHIQLHHQLPTTLQLLSQPTIKQFLQELSDKIDAGVKTYEDYLKSTADRMIQYQNYFKEFVKYSARAKLSTKSMQKALELTLSVPQRAKDMEFINNIQQYPGDTNRLGRLYRHDRFLVWEGEGEQQATERYIFLFKNKLMITDRNESADAVTYKHYATIRLPKYTVKQLEGEDNTLELKPNELGLPEFKIRAKDAPSVEFIRQAWLKDIQEMQEYAASEQDIETETTEFDMNMSDIRSEFSEYSTLSHKSSYFNGPEEGPPRKKIKSPPAISPTGSSTSLYSGGSSSIDWTTTGTTLDMQGTRVTRTQYGFRTLQESSAKMCLKVTGYPLPDITWYKDDELLHEDERHTFYSDDDGFFALTIDPVKIEDTGRYTCMATNEYGQASTSAFFRVLKVEKEAAPPAFVNTLKDQEVKEGEVASFECEVEGWPEPELLWLIDEQPLRPSHDFRLEYDGQNAKLEIRDAQPEDTGIYTVRIKNEYGSAESNAKLTVQADPDKNHVAPEFQATIEDVECDEGDTVRFKAILTGDPNPEVTWLVNGIPLSESDKIKFISEDGICIITIQDVSRHFDGIVTCQGTNRLGSQSCDGRLKVRVAPTPPNFIRPLEDKMVMEGDTLMFEIELSGFPDPKVSFSINGNEIVSGKNGINIFERGGGVYRLEVGSVSAELDGELVCKAINESGQAESRARIVVEAVEEERRTAPIFIKDIENQTVKYGENAIFETSVKANPKADVSWFLNGQKLDKYAQGVTIETIDENDYKLTLDSTQYAGTVLCRAENSVGRFETKAKLVVLTAEKKPKAPEFLERLTDVCSVEESTAVFEVRVDAEPKENLKWFLNDEQLQESEDIHIREFDGSCKLELHNVSLKQNGILRCIAENSAGQAECSSSLKITRKPCAPKFDKALKSITTERGEEVRFEAHADAVPNAVYQWSVDGRKVRASTDGARIELLADSNISVLIIDTHKFNSSVITVTAENSLGVDESGARLTVEERKVKTEETLKTETISESAETITTTTTKESLSEDGKLITEKITETYITKTVDESQLPVIKKPLSDQYVKPGDKAHFKAIIAPVESVQWFNNGKLLDNTLPGVKIDQSENFEFSLTLDSAQYAGVVSIRGQNSSGTVETSANLITSEEHTNLPQILAGLTDITVTEGDRLKISVTTSNALKIEWIINGTVIHDGMNGIKIIENENGSVLEMSEVKKEFAGEICVTISNTAGQTSSKSNLFVNDRPVAPEILNGPDSVLITEGEKAEFKCDITGKPEPSVEWKINEQVIEYGIHENMILKCEDGKHTLSFKETTVKDAGEICVTAENAGGIYSRCCVLKVEADVRKPIFKTQLIDRSVSEGEPLRWDVTIERTSHETKVRWLLNDEELTNTENIQIVDHGDGSHHLTILEAKSSMNGTLIVQAENIHGSSVSKAKINIEETTQKPEFVKSPQDHETVEETSVKFSAVVTGKPTPTVSWFINETKIESSEEFHVKYEESTGKTSIRIMKPVESQSGKVTVRAENSSGMAEAKATLKVEKRKEPPRFLADMDSRQVSEGDTVKFAINVEGVPEPEIQWFLNGTALESSSNVVITKTDGTHTLTMYEVTPEQSGEISCEARNSVGLKKQNATMTVKMTGQAPTFSKNLEDRLVVEGDELMMEAQLAQVKPKPTISWLRDGIALSDNRFVVTEEDSGILRLKIASTQMSDKSRITIRAENIFGSAECSASIGIQKKRPMAKPAFLSEIAPIIVTEGESLKTKVIITGDPTPFAKWYINDQLVCATEDTEMTSENGVYSLTVHGATKDMTGTIKCTAYNKMGEVTIQGKVNVVAPVPVEFETTLCDATCREGDTLKLKAVLLGEPTPVVTWYVNGRKLEESQNIKIHAEKGTYTVTIKDITCEYSGKVVCEAVNEFGKASSEAMLLVLPRGEPPDFLEWLSNVRARPGSQVTHKVIFTGDPVPKLTWFINNEEVTESEEISITTTDNTSTLIIKSFKPDKHIGEIICKAENEAGEVSCTASMGTYTSDMFSESESEAFAEEVLDFEDATEQGTEQESLTEEMHRTPTPVMAPKFITKIKDTRAAKGHQAIFECVVPDTKGVCCKWLKDGKEIELIARIRVQTRTLEGFITSELIIDEVEAGDAGRYEVLVENVSGCDKCEATLNVFETITKEVKAAPEFIISLQNKTVRAADKIVFECKVNGEPQPTVTWFHDKIAVVEEARRTVIESDGSVQRLVIIGADFDDRGKYVCVAENEVGKTQTEAELTVQAEAPQFTHTMTEKEINVGDKLVLECAVKGAPQPTVQFFVDSKRLVSNDHCSIEHDRSNTYWRLVIDETKPEDFTKYLATATNAVGVVECEAQVKEKQSEKVRPKIEQGLKARTINESEELRIEVKVSGRPEPEVKWFKDGKPIEEVDLQATIINQPDGAHILTVKNARLEDTGEYAIEVTNAAGKEMCAANVTVLESVEAPHFIECLADQKVKIGERVEMKVVSSGKPMPHVEWFKDEYPVNIDNEHVISKKNENGVYTLIIDHALLEDVGVYTCKASNRGGSDETKANFVVEQEEGAPIFSERLGEVNVMESEMAKLSVIVEGEPQPEVEWLKNGVAVNIDNEHLIAKQGEKRGEHTLIIKDARLEDAGIYSCKATNARGSDETKAVLAVESELQSPVFIDDLKELTVNEAESAKLSVVVEGKPEPIVEWFRDGEPVNIDNVHVISKDDEHSHTLLIKDVTLQDSGTYSCKAANKAGVSETKAHFAVQQLIVAPVFEEQLHEFQVEKGEQVQLSCSVMGKPEPDVKWFKDGNEIHIDNNQFIKKDDEHGQHTLIIAEVNQQNIGTYSCVASNEAGQAETSAEVKFPKYGFEKVPEEETKPIFIEPLQSHSVNVGETADFECRVNVESKPEIKWFRDGKQIGESENIMIEEELEKGLFKLKVMNATIEHIGTYSCEAVNRLGKASTEAELKLNYATAQEENIEDESGVINFIKPIEDVVVEEGNVAKLECALNVARDDVKVKWSKDGKSVPSEAVIESSVEGIQTLTINELSPQQVGTYRCTASDASQSTYTEGKLAIAATVAPTLEEAKSEQPPEFVQLLKSCTTTENGEAILRCKVKGYPRPSVSWSKDGTEIQSSNNVTMDYQDDGTAILHIKETSLNEIGEYRCDAVNEFGTAWTEAPINYGVERTLPHEGEAPDFMEPVHPVTVMEGETAVLEGKVSGEPKPEVKWYKGDEIVKESDKIQIEQLDDGTQRLIIKNSTQEDTGEYRCSASNEFGDVWSDVTCTVQLPATLEEEPMELAAPTFLQTLEETNAKESDYVALECVIVGEPMPEIKWYKDKKEISADDAHFEQETLSDGTARLIIKSALKADAGEYRCEARNPSGTARTEALLTVLYAFEEPLESEISPEFIIELKPVEANEGQVAVFECRVSGVPRPEVKWFKDGGEVKPDEHIRIETLSDGTNRLTIDSTQLDDQGNYRCEATNTAGSMSSKAPMTVNAPETLKVLKELEDVNISEGSDIHLYVEVEGKPDTVKWFKEKEEIISNNKTTLSKVSDQEYELKIGEARLSDSGAYRVVLSTEAESVESSSRVTVNEKITEMSFRKGLDDKVAPKGCYVSFEIEVDGKPKQIKWYKDGNPIEKMKTKTEDLGNGKYRVIIPEMNEEDVGTYTVKVSNEIGSAESSAKLTIEQVAPTTIEIVNGLKDASVAEGEQVQLEIETSSKPEKAIWYKDGDEIKPSDEYKPEIVNETTCRLTIPSANAGDTADFKVIVWKDNESALSSCSLVVHPPLPVELSITKALQDQTVAHGQKVVLEIEVSHPPKQVKWYKNGKEITPSDKARAIAIDDKKFQLEIPDADKNDSADYTVVVSSDNANAVDSSCALRVKLPKLIITKALQDQIVPHHETAKMSIEVTHEPRSIKWYKNGKEISPSDRAKPKKISDTKYALEIPEVTADDTAEYSVFVEDDDGNNADSSCALTVKLPPLVITKKLDDQSVNVGEKVHMGIEVNSKPTTVKWYKNGKEITDADKEKPVEVNDTNYQLEIADASLDETADYKVVVSNEDSSADSNCKLTVKQLIEKPSFKKGIEDSYVPVGKPFVIQIETTGCPKTVKWYKNGQIISADKMGRIKMKKIDDNNYVLSVEKSEVDADSGTYSVVIENEAGKAKSSGEVTVEPEIIFIEPLKDVDVVEGEEAELTVKTNCHPHTVKWYKNGTEIKAVDGKLAMINNTTKFRIRIPKTAMNDAGAYKIVLSNSVGDADSTAKLTVRKAKGQPIITKGLHDQVIAKGTELILEVKVDGEPTEVRWLKNGQIISKNTSAKIEKIDGETYRLTIPNADTTDAGSYTAEVMNEVGKLHTTGNIEVDEKPEIVDGLKDDVMDEDEEHRLTVETSVPVRTVKWYKNGREIKATPKVTMKMINLKKYELFFASLVLDDTATYKVVLSNSAGECDSSATLTVKKPNILRIIKGLTDVNLNEGEMIELRVKVEGQPRQVKWYKNGQQLSADTRIELIENSDTGEYTLKIPTCQAKDGAAYRVVLSNEKSEVQSSAIAHVKVKKVEPTVSAPLFITPLEDVSLPEGETLTLKCKVTNEPIPEIKWERDGVEMHKSDRIVMRTALDGTVTLRVIDVNGSDAARYCVRATNSVGQSSSECNVTVIPEHDIPCAPKFVIPLKTTSVEVASKCELCVKVRGLPKPTLRWFINDREITAADDIVIEDMNDGHWTMLIPESRSEHAGIIRCEARNEHGKDECEAELRLTEPKPSKLHDEEGYPPRFNVPLWDRRIPEGQLMSIECHVDAKPMADIKWSKDGVSLSGSDRLTITNTSDGACRLRIIMFDQNDTGIYKCLATNSYGSAETHASLNVQVEEMEKKEEKVEYAPRFNPPLTDRFVNDGEKTILNCRVDAVPTASVIWYKDGIPLKSDGRTSTECDDEGNCLLTIFSANESDDGAYRCIATNIHGSTNTACVLSVKKTKEQVKKGGEEPFFTKGLVDKWLDRGDTLELSCTVIGDPEPTIKWYRNGMLLRPTARIKIEKCDDGRCTLVINDCTMSDEGIYRCEAENSFGKAKTQSTTHVHMAVGKSDAKKIAEGTAPRFVIPLEDLVVHVGSTFELECKVTGNPSPQVKWSKDGAPIWNDPQYLFESDMNTGVHKLKVVNAVFDDEGTYRCVATNDVGSATTKSFVRFDDGLITDRMPSVLPPRFAISLGDARAVEGETLKMECKVEGVPLPSLVWYKDGEKITPSDRIRTELDADGSARLVISPCNVDDEGIYRVIATSSSGSTHDKGTAYVKKLPAGVQKADTMREPSDTYHAPRLIVPLESTKTLEGARLVLSCRFSADPKATIRWFKDGERVYAYGNCQLVENDDGTCELILQSVGRFDGGAYRCVAENEYGSARSTCEVVLQLKEKKASRIGDELSEGKAPGFIVPLMMKRVKQGESAVLECVPYGKPFPSIKWLKDGIEITEDNNMQIECMEDGVQRLTIKQTEFCYEGYYRCVATNEFGTASSKGELVVEGDRTIHVKKAEELSAEPVESKPRIRRGLYNMSIHQGSTIEMQVCTSGWPTPTVKWFKNGEEISGEGADGRRVIWTDERGIHRCVILNCLPEDEGEYALEASNKLGSARTEGLVNVVRPREVQMFRDTADRSGMPYPPGFIRQLKNKHIFSHMPTIFDCLVIGHPPPEVDWYHNGKKIVPGGRIRIQSCGGGSHAIIILDTSVEDAGEYVAVARNGSGTASSSAVLDVTVPHLDEIKFDGSVDVTPYLTEEYGFRKLNYAAFPTPPDRGPFIKEVTGHYLTLSWIPTKRAPPRYPQVTYVIEIRELPEKEWTLLDYNIPEPVCKVRNLELGKSYQFRVRAENIYGISDPSPASPPSRLMAPPQPVLDKNKRVIPLLDPYAERALDQAYAQQYACAPWFAPGVVEKRFCAENDTLTLTLHVSGYPDPKIVWKFRGWDVDSTGPFSKNRVTTYGGTETILTITGFSKENVGQYQCLASNQYGEAQQNIFVDLASRPSFLQPLVDKTVSTSKVLRLDVRVEGNPFPELKWMKEWRPIVESSRARFVHEGPYLCSLIITDPMWRDSGIYSVTAINEAGSVTTSCTVTVQAEDPYKDVQLPKKKVALESRKVRELYEIDENDEKAAAAGAPFHVTERGTGKRFLAQLRALDENLTRNIQFHNTLDHPNIVQFHQVIMDQGIAVLIYENVGRTLLDGLIAGPSSQKHRCTEYQVQVFVKQLLTALKFMHDRKIAHLDLRPEVILLQDDHLCLADFGQSRRSVRGKIVANVMSSPEFVSPEIAAGLPATLASDMWSVGALTYVLLSGISPFLGDSDAETIRNVLHSNYLLDTEELSQVTDEAKQFIANLLVLDPKKRLNVNEALNHPWLAVSLLENAKLTSECLREFKYRHKWLERRVFVQQTPTQRSITSLQSPDAHIASTEAQHGLLSQSEPSGISDYVRIKDHIPPRTDHIFASSTALAADSSQQRATSKPGDSQRSDTVSDVSDEQMLPLRLVRGEYRDIEEEIANRILSDISEENSIASADEVEQANRTAKESRPSRQPKSRSRSSTPNAEGYSLETTPLMSPTLTIESVETTTQQFFADNGDLSQHPSQLDPKVPIGAPLFLEGLSRPHALTLQDQESPQNSRHSMSPRSLPGTKSPVLLSPGKEYSMEVIIGTKQGIPQVEKTHFEMTEEMKPTCLTSANKEQKANQSTHDDEFNRFMNQIESTKELMRKDRDNMEKYRPKNFYKEDDGYDRPTIDEDDFAWESNYQIGPDTLLLATRGAAFNARVRDYRRELWGDGAPFVSEGILGYRNQDITVRERRRFTDLLREDIGIAKSVRNLERDMCNSHNGAIRRIQSDISKMEPEPNRKDGTFGAIFKRRLKDVAFVEDTGKVVFECEVVGNPKPTIVWFYHESAITNDAKYEMRSDGSVHRLTLNRPSLADVGEYSCLATNQHGADKTSARLIASDKPASPGRPEIELSSDTEVFITWEPPPVTSCLEGFTYKLEIRPAGENDHFCEWRLISDDIDEEAVVVHHMSPLGVYQFRVTAKNAFGWSNPSLTSRIIRTHPKGSPKLQIDVLKQQYHLCILSKPAKPQLLVQSLAGIMEEDEDEAGIMASTEADQVAIPSLILNDRDDPEKRFKLGSELFNGRFCVILNAVDSKAELGKNCIAKIVQLSSESQNLLDEFSALKECQHENVLHLIAAYKKENSLYLFSEKLCENIFERFTYKDYYNEEQISKSIMQIAAALHWIHFKRIAHLDIQPSNVMFVSKRSWHLKLIDFGSANAINSQRNPRQTFNTYWSAPELFSETNQPVTGQSDVWSLGVITFCLLSGFHPFASEGDTEAEIKDSVLHEKCNPNMIFVQATQESLRFVTWALKKDALKRIRTAEALTHRWFSNDSSMVRRRETIKYPSSRLRKTMILTATGGIDTPCHVFDGVVH